MRICKTGFRIIFLVLFLFSSCSRRAPQNVVAVVNGEYITQKDFFESYTNLILYGNQFDSEKNRLDHLNRLIDTYLLAQHGMKNVDSAVVGRYTRRAFRKAVRDYHLNAEVIPKTPQPTENDLRKTFLYRNQKIHLKHIYADSKEKIDSLYSLFKTGRSFESLAYDVFEDSLLRSSGGDLGWNQLGDLDPFLEDVAFTLKPGEISLPVESRFGWHILKLENKLTQAVISEDDYQMHKSEIRKQFIRREQDKIYYRYVNDFMSDKTATIHNPEWSQVAAAIRARFPLENARDFFAMQLPFSPEFGPLTDSLEAIKDNPVVTFPDGDQWTVAEFLDMLPNLPRKMLYGSLRKATNLLIKDYLLFKEGLKRGYGQKAEVKNSVLFQKNLIAGKLYRNHILTHNLIPLDSIPSVTVEEIYNSQKDSRFTRQRVFDYSMLLAPDSATARKMDLLLTEGKDFNEVIGTFGIRRLGTLESGRFQKDSDHLASLFQQTLLHLKDGEVSDWLVVNRRLAKLKRYKVDTEYKSFEEVKESIQNEIQLREAYKVLSDSLKTFREKAQIKVFPERLTLPEEE